jgi:serine/threonine protein kinase
MVGEKLGSFRVESTLGIGAMGVVYKAVNETTNKVAAVKVINGEVSQKGKTFERFRREAEILQQFRHPNIVRFLALGRYQGTSYFAMEYVQGETLEQVLKRKEMLDWKEVVELGIQLSEALQYAHEHGIVHRDLKPSNLMVTTNGTLKLTDFGIAKDLDATALTATGRTLGTAAYMAPEQIRGSPEVSHKTDLYALGCVFYQMLTGQLPFEGSSAMVMMHGHLNGPVPRPSGKLAEIPKALDDLVYQLMAKDPQDRPWDAGVVLEKLKAIREKANKGETIKMVWPGEAANTPSPIDATTFNVPPSAPLNKPKSRKAKGKGRSSSDSGTNPSMSSSTRRIAETAGLIGALVAIAALIGYFVKPPGQEYLYRHAKPLMASDKRHDWENAREYYIEPLERRFPDNPYKDEIREWRDKVLLADAEGRAGFLASSVAAVNQPKTAAEQKYVVYNSDVVAARKEWNDLRALALLDEFIGLLKPDDPEDRPWYLLARKRAKEIRDEIKSRGEMVTAIWLRATSASKEGQTARAEELFNEAVEKYGKYTDAQAKFHELGPVFGIPPNPKLFESSDAPPAVPRTSPPEISSDPAGTAAPVAPKGDPAGA